MAFHIFRRCAVYYYRRRPPCALASVIARPHVLMSLKTTSHVTARRLAAQLDLILEDAAMLAADNNDHQLSQSQIETMLHAVVDKNLSKLERIALVAKSTPAFDVEQARADDKRAYWTYALLDAQGGSASVRPVDRVRMTADGLSEADIEAVLDHLAMLRFNELVPTKPHVLQKMLEEVSATETAMNLNIAEGIRYRGMKLALAEVDRRYGGSRIEDRDFVDRVLLAKNDPQSRVSQPWPESDVIRRDPHSGSAPTLPFVATAEFLNFAEAVTAQQAKEHQWSDKTQKQAKSIAKLFVKFMLQDQLISDLNSLRQIHIGKFVDFLRMELYRQYGKSPKDEDRTIEQLRANAAIHSSEDRGIETGTLNRHLRFLSKIFRHAGPRGVETLASIDLSSFYAKSKKVRARYQRAKLPLDQAASIFRTPPFTNSLNWKRLREPGPDGLQVIFHCALYFVPILIFYTGCRREELCGLTWMTSSATTEKSPIFISRRTNRDE